MKDQEHVNDILQKFVSSNKLKTNGVSYDEATFKEWESSVQYIRILQDDWDVYLWDKPQNDQRTVYRLDKLSNIIAKATIKKDGNIVENKNQLKWLKYDPINNQ